MAGTRLLAAMSPHRNHSGKDPMAVSPTALTGQTSQTELSIHEAHYDQGMMGMLP